jgi:hypothetical protein
MLAHKIKLVVGANPIDKVLAVKASPIGKDSAMVVTAVRILHRMSHSGASFCRFTGPSKDPIELSEEIPGEIEQISRVEDGQWTNYFDESSTAKEEGGVGILLKSPKGESTSLSFSFQLEFPCSNNSSEYEANAIGLSIAKDKEMKIKK